MTRAHRFLQMLTATGVALMAVGGVGAILALSPAMAAALSRE